jgi:hypothetical protein
LLGAKARQPKTNKFALERNQAGAILRQSGWPSPSAAEQMVGDKVKISITSLPVRRPHDAAQESGTYGGQGKAVGCASPAALLFVEAISVED